MQNFSDGSALKVTIAKWFTPDGVNISATGISPDIWATSTNATTSVKVGTTTKIIDMQLKNAIDILMNLK
jgi:carboxyl-terminal processing protease